MREVTGIPENLSSDYSLKAIFDSNKTTITVVTSTSNKCYHKTEYTSVNRMRRLQKSRSKVDVITTPGTKITRLPWP